MPFEPYHEPYHHEPYHGSYMGGYPWIPGSHYGYPYMQGLPEQVLAATAPIVRHGIREIKAGVSIEHTLKQVAAQAYLAGMGVPPERAIMMVERWEEMGYLPYRRRRKR